MIWTKEPGYILTPVKQRVSPSFYTSTLQYSRLPNGDQRFFCFLNGLPLKNANFIADRVVRSGKEGFEWLYINSQDSNLPYGLELKKNCSDSTVSTLNAVSTFRSLSKLQNIQTTTKTSKKVIFPNQPTEIQIDTDYMPKKRLIEGKSRVSSEFFIYSPLLFKNEDYPLKVNENRLLIPLPGSQDMDILGLLYLEALETIARKSPERALLYLAETFEKYQESTGHKEEILELPNLVHETFSPAEIIGQMKEDYQESIVSKKAAEIAASLSGNDPLLDFESPVTQALKEETHPAFSPMADQIFPEDYYQLRAVEKDTLKKQRKAEFAQKKYWKKLSEEKRSRSKAEQEILTRAVREQEHKKTLFKYLTQSEINAEAKRTGARISYNPASHGHITLSYDDGRPDVKFLISTHLKKGHKKIAQMGAHVFGHKFRNLELTQNTSKLPPRM